MLKQSLRDFLYAAQYLGKAGNPSPIETLKDGSVVLTSQNGRIRTIYNQPFSIGAAKLQTLNSFPIALVTPLTPTSIVVPKFMYQFVKVGTVALSIGVTLTLSIDISGNLISADLPIGAVDGSVAFAQPWDIEADLFSAGLGSGLNYAAVTGAIGSPLFLKGDQDATGGDGTVLKLLLTYDTVETAGDI